MTSGHCNGHHHQHHDHRHHHPKPLGVTDEISYIEGSAPMLLAANMVVSATGNFSGQTLTISGLLAEDVIGFGSGVTVTGNSLRIGNSKVATFTGGTSGSDLVITFGKGVVAHDVQTLLHSLTYSDVSDDPEPSHVLTINVAGTVHTELVSVTAVNDAPVVDLNGAANGASASLDYVENQAPIAIAPVATVSDADTPDFKGGSLTVSFAGGGTSGDQLSIGNQGTGAGQIGISGNTLTFGGTAIGTVSGGTNGVPLGVTFTSDGATPEAVQALIRDILFFNTSDDPSALVRMINYALNDGDGTANGGHDIGSATATVHVTAVNDAPAAADDTGSAAEQGGVNNTSDGSPATGNVLFNDTDPDNANAQLTVSAIRTGTESGTGTSGTVGLALAGAHGTLTLHGDGSYTYVVNDGDSDIQALNSGQSVSDVFTYTVSDPGGLSDQAQLVITIQGADDAPVTAPMTLTAIDENSGARLITQAELLANASDVDSPTLTASNLLVTSGGGTLVDNGDGSWSYTPSPWDDTAVGFSYTVSDGSLTALGSASLDITPIEVHGIIGGLAEPVSGPHGQTEAHWSSDGSKLFLLSTATLTADDTDGGAGSDLFAVNLANGVKTLLTPSLSGGWEGDTWFESTNPDSTKLVFGSTSVLTPDESAAQSNADLFVRDFATGTEMRVTTPIAGGFEGDTMFAGWNSDGTKFLLQSESTLTADDTDNGNGWDVFVVNAATGEKTLLTVPVPGGVEGSFSAAVWSPDGSKIIVETSASLTSDDNDNGWGGWDLFSYDVATGTKTLLTPTLGGGWEGSSTFAGWSPDGTKFAITSNGNLTPDVQDTGGGSFNVFIADLTTGDKTLLTHLVAGGHQGDSDVAGWSPDGGTLLISSTSTLTSDDPTDDVGADLFAVNLGTGATTLLTGSVSGGAEGDSWLEGWSPDGSTLIVGSTSNLTADDTDGNAGLDLFAVDLTSGAKTLLTAPVAGGADGSVRFAGWSPDGTKILLASTATLTADDTNGSDWDLFSIDLTTGVKTLLTGSTPGGFEGDSDFVYDVAHGSHPVWSADGQSVRIITSSTLVDADADNGGNDLYWINVTTGERTLTDLGVDHQDAETAWAQQGAHGETLVGLATDVTDYLLVT